MSWFRPQHFLRLAVIALLALNVVPEAFAAFPICTGFASPAAADTFASPSAAVRHSHGMGIDHECMATKPDRQSVAHQTQLSADNAVAVVPAVAHPASMLDARGPSPRGSPTGGSAYLAQRSSVLLLI